MTLTYDQFHLPPSESLHYPDFQAFMRRLRKRVRLPLRFYMCGEYGEDLSRPHYHLCLFGYNFPDLILSSKSSSGESLYTSSLLSSLWPLGFHSVQDLNSKSAAYCARYVTQKILGDSAHAHYSILDADTGELVSRVHPFNRMSLKPGIGAGWFSRFSSDVYPHDYVIRDGVKTTPPRYYDKLRKRQDAVSFEATQFSRELKARGYAGDNTPSRLLDKQVCTLARVRRLKRTL